ncbi:MAG: pseudouridine synthase [Saprospiraceae bacterium]|nr:pseudouridine synthase [Saprospiraceae bacterium]
MTSPSKEGMRLNKYVAHCGVTSRRKAVDLIESGKIKVNGKIEKIPYVLVTDQDVVEYNNKVIRPIEKKVYLLLNKPKDVISTTSDEHGRKSVIDLVPKYEKYNLHTVGRLDRMTTGLLLLTNDGDLTQKLTHPSSEVKKIYQVVLDRPFSQKDLDTLKKGVTLEDGFIKPDKLAYDRTEGRNVLGIELHSGRNRIIRRMIDHMGYEVVKLDRVYFAGLTKKDLPRGRYRELTEREIIMLKHFT